MFWHRLHAHIAPNSSRDRCSYRTANTMRMCFFVSISDPKIKEDVQNYLDQNNHHYSDCDSSSQSRSYTTSPHLSSPQLHHTNNTSRPSRIPTIIRSPVHMSSKHSAKSGQTPEPRVPRISQIPKANGNNSSSHNMVANNCPTLQSQNEPAMKKKCGFEAYMMTGDLILNLSRTQQTSGITTHSKKVGIDSSCWPF